jgi:hypothetical protein
VLCVQGGDGGGAIHSVEHGAGAGFGPKSSLLGLGFEHFVGNSNGEQWGKVVGQCICSSRVLHSVVQRGSSFGEQLWGGGL